MTDVDNGYAPPATLRVNPQDAKFQKGNYKWEVTKAVYFVSPKNPDWKVLRVHVRVAEGKSKGWPSQFFLQLPLDEENQFYRSHLNAIVKFASACAGAQLDDEFEIEFTGPNDEGEFICPIFDSAQFYAYNDVEVETGYIKWDMSKLFLSDPEAERSNSPY